MKKIIILLFLAVLSLNSLEAHISPLPPSTTAFGVHPITGLYTETEQGIELKGPLGVRLTHRLGKNSEMIEFGGWHWNSLYLEGNDPREEKVGLTLRTDLASPSIKIVGPTETVYGSVTFRSSPKGDQWSATTHDGRRYAYALEKGLIASVKKPDGSSIEYEYVFHPVTGEPLISKKSNQMGTYIENSYYHLGENQIGDDLVVIDSPYDARIGKVALQKAPAAKDGSAVVVSQFYYGEDYTLVVDGNGAPTLYEYDPETFKMHSITYAERQPLLKASRPELSGILKKEHYLWKGDLLSVYRLEDGSGAIVLETEYFYDDQDHLIQETLKGNLSGESSSQWESYSKFYTYSKEGHHLIEEYEDNGNAIQYFYNLLGQLTLKRKSHLGLCKREGFIYNEDGILIETIVDDGTSDDMEDLMHVTQRHFSRMTLTSEGHLRGLPKIIEELHLNKETGELLRGKTLIHTYNAQGQLIQSDQCDAIGACRRVAEAQYDGNGRLLYTKGEEGKEILLSYGNGTKNAIDLHSGIEIVTVFDYMGRPFQRIHSDSTGKVLVSSESYDPMGRKVADSDEAGNYTYYTIDDLGRIIAITQPAIESLHGERIVPISYRSYNALGQLVLSRDAQGNETQFAYNVRGKPIYMRTPSGIESYFQYNLDGTLKKEISKGVEKSYQRDGWGRPLEINLYDKEGRVLSSEKASYDAFHEVARVHASAEMDLLTYDATGRLSELVREIDGAFSVQNFSYNALGEIDEMVEWLDAGKEKFKRVRYERDERQKVIAAHIEGSGGEKYVLSADQEGETLPYISQMDEFVKDAFDQNVRRTTFADQEGDLLVQTKNALGHLVSIEKRSPFGHLHFKQEMVLDANGNKLEERLETPYRTSKTRWEYGLHGKVEKLVEFATQEAERITLYRYNDLEQLESIIKPDGVELHHEYDEKGRLCRLSASDQSFSYAYFYDESDRAVRIEDEIYQNTTLREYTLLDKVVYEKLGNGFTMRYKYDAQGRKIETVLPDESAVRYSYDCCFLRLIERIGTDADVLYSHAYDDYNDKGLPLVHTLPSSLGKVHYNYDARGRLTEIKAPFYSEIIPENAYNAKGNIDFLYTQYLGVKEKKQFSYDGLHQLIAEEGKNKVQYAYDSFGNRMRKGDETYRFNEKHQVVKIKDKVYGYDVNGNLLFEEKEGDRTHYHYDALGRLLGVEKAQTLTLYQYDAFNRRLVKQEMEKENGSWVLTKILNFIYDGDKEIGSMDENGNWNELRILGQGLGAEIGASIAIEKEGKTYIPLHDHQGSICVLINLNTEKVEEYYQYTAYGEESLYNAAGEKIEKAISPWRFSSKRIDEESGFIHFGKRSYIPTEGRWATPDLLGSFDSFNRYCFLKNNPLVHTDLYGLFSISSVIRSSLQFLKSAKQFFTDFQDSFLAPWMSGMDLNLIDSEMKQVVQSIYGEAFYVLSGFEEHPPVVGVQGNGEISDKLRISFICGMLNTKETFDYAVNLISSTHNNNVHFVYRGSGGWGDDLVNCFFLKMGYISNEAVALSDMWKNLIEEMGGTKGGGLIIHYAHSIGGAETLAAGGLLTPEEKRMIRVITMGSPVLITDEGFHSVVNYVAVRDFVPLLDPVRYILSLAYEDYNTEFIGHWMGPPQHFLGEYWLYMAEKMQDEVDRIAG